MRRFFRTALASVLPLLLPAAALAQAAQTPQNQDLWISINKPAARKVAIAVPDLATPGTATKRCSYQARQSSASRVSLRCRAMRSRRRRTCWKGG